MKMRANFVAACLGVLLFVGGHATGQTQRVPAAATIDQLYGRFQKGEAALDASPPAARPASIVELYSTNIAAQ